jgi:TetR/AcrR family transcriptional regulator, transcriptional repressor for nem operon
MARTKEFDPDVALDRAVEVFRASSFEAVSTAELCEAMGIARQSLYDTFGDKASLYRAALTRYRERSRGEVEVCTSGHSPLRALSNVFDMVAGFAKAECVRGCMMVNAISELAAVDSEVASIARQNQRAMIGVFADLIRSGQALGEIRPDVDPDVAATQLVITYCGIRVAAKADPASQTVRAAARRAVDFLRLPD